MRIARSTNTYSNPVTVAALIRANGLNAVISQGQASRRVIRQVRQGLLRAEFQEYRRMLAERNRTQQVWRALKFARRHGPRCLDAGRDRVFAGRLISGLLDAWNQGCDIGVIGRRHGWDVGLQLKGMDRPAIEALGHVMGIDLRLSEKAGRAVAADLGPAAVSPVRLKFEASRRVMRRACRLFAVTPAEVGGPSRARRVTLARDFYCFWVKRLGRMSYPEIGRRLGGRDHTTILHAVRTWPDKRAKARQVISMRGQR